MCDAANGKIAYLKRVLKERTQRAHSYGQWLAEQLNRPASHQGRLWEQCPSQGCANTREALNWMDYDGDL